MGFNLANTKTSHFLMSALPPKAGISGRCFQCLLMTQSGHYIDTDNLRRAAEMAEWILHPGRLRTAPHLSNPIWSDNAFLYSFCLVFFFSSQSQRFQPSGFFCAISVLASFSLMSFLSVFLGGFSIKEVRMEFICGGPTVQLALKC